MLKQLLKIDLWSLLLVAATPSAAQSPSDINEHSGGLAQVIRGSVESENSMPKWRDGSSSWMSSRAVLTAARAASGM